MQESVDSEENTEINNDSSCDNSVRARSPEIPERASKILKNDSYSDCEEHINLDESPSEPTSLNDKFSMVKEDSGFVDKLSVSSGDAVPTAEVSESFNNNKEFRDAISSPNKKSPANSLFPSDVSFPKNSPQLKRRNYRKRSMIDMDSDEDCDNLESTTTNDCMVDDHEDANSATAVDDDSTLEEDNIMDSYFDSEDSSDDSSDFDVHRELKYQRENDNVVPLVLLKPKPKHNWQAVPEILNRPYGLVPSQNQKPKRSWGYKQFQDRYYSSLHAVQRLELMYKLEAHESCVNSLGFNKSGSLLASGSDDLFIHIWDWTIGRKATSFKSGHRSNVFQSKFLPFAGDIHIASSARDGQVRLSILSPAGELISSRHLCQHRGMVNKISLVSDQPHIILSAGDDGVVISTDIRDPVPNKIAKVKNGSEKVSLYSINCHPMLGHEFVLGSNDHYVRIYDTRNTRVAQAKFKPASETKRLDKKPDRNAIYTTAVIYNYNGREILASYTDDNLYLFSNDPTTIQNISSSSKETERDYIGCYTGHKNQATIKSCNFFGPHSEYIVSGSDCSYCYIWEKKTESIVQWFRADESGVVNCMEPHPHIPILATSGLDNDVKIWVPSKEEPNPMEEMKTVVRQNKDRRYSYDHTVGRDTIDGQMLWMFLTHINNVHSTSHSDSSDDDLPRSGEMPCSPS
ncbi:DDB1- and CUL4-associated factor 8-like isoform X2 [Ctenocephalides felis]|uniref:DDB1- and CUL4-associated factor 8-like isoform X2 n=1 Tax=Ctenocephalides felis TaxID=7515 RepID=UPI000E6E5AA0|nr:DDB1- and CUL4-associated factor 8-like isoform X2 [Ctenocephalides felis]